MKRLAQRRELAARAVAHHGASIALGCRPVRCLEQVMEWRGRPEAIRMDNGPEFVSHTLVSWTEKQGIILIYTQPGNLQQNTYIERHNRTVRQEWLEQSLFESIQDVQEVATQWLWIYN
jgi:putative transposase